MKIFRPNKQIIHINQIVYIDKILARFRMYNAKTAKTPLLVGWVPSENDKPVDPVLKSKFQSVIGSLLYLMIGTRPDIAFAVIKLSSFSANPSKEHLDKAFYIMHYLIRTKDLVIEYSGITK